MEGVQFLVDDHGNPTSVIVDLDILGDKWEYIYETMRAEAPDDEPTMSWQQVKAELRASIDRDFDGFDDEDEFDDGFADYDKEGSPQ